MFLDKFMRHVKLTGRGVVASIPVGGDIFSAYVSDQDAALLRSELQQMHESFVTEVRRRLEALDAEGRLATKSFDTLAQVIRFGRYGRRAFELNDDRWRYVLAGAFCSQADAEEPPGPRLCATLDELMLSLLPDDVTVLRHLRDNHAPADSMVVGVTKGAGAAHIAGQLGWPPASVESSAARLLALGLIRDIGVGFSEYTEWA